MSAEGRRLGQDAESVLSLNTGAGPGLITPEGDVHNPARPKGYWERVRRIVDAAPPLTDDQRARIRAAFHQPASRAAA